MTNVDKLFRCSYLLGIVIGSLSDIHEYELKKFLLKEIEEIFYKENLTEQKP